MESNKNWKGLVFLIGGVTGLAAGLAAAALIIKRKENTGAEFRLNSGEGFKLGMSLVTLLKQISETGFKK